jgi:hypothetical protein
MIDAWFYSRRSRPVGEDGLGQPPLASKQDGTRSNGGAEELGDLVFKLFV